jgi:hypothetical protein
VIPTVSFLNVVIGVMLMPSLFRALKIEKDKKFFLWPSFIPILYFLWSVLKMK